MLRNLLYLFGILLISSTTSIAQKTSSLSTVGNPDKAAAETLGLAIIEGYFSGDCIFPHLAAEVRSFESGQVFQTAGMQTAVCQENPLRTDIKVNYQMYRDNYEVTVLGGKEVSNQHPELFTHLKMQKGDMFFNGMKLKTETSKEVFRAADMARFVLRKDANGVWKVISI